MNFLPGWFPGAAAGGLSSIRFLTSASAVNAQVIVPPGVRKGDFLFCTDFAGRSTTGQTMPPAKTPPGFTLIAIRDIDLFTNSVVSAKIADGTEGGQELSGGEWVGDNKRMALFVVRGNAPIKSFAVRDVLGGFGPGGAAQFPSVMATSNGSTPLMAFSVMEFSSGTTGAPTVHDFAPPSDFGEHTAGPRDMWSVFKIMNKAPVDLVPGAPVPDGNIIRWVGWIELQ